MALTTAQFNAAVKADIAANSDLNTNPNNDDGAYAIAALYNVSAVPSFTVWCSTIPSSQIFNGIVWANLTPNDAPDGTQVWADRSLCCQGKQFNIQTMLGGQQSLSTGLASIRAGLQDALTNIPSGTGGAIVSAGWVALRDGVLKRLATRLEKLLADTSGGNGAAATPAALVYEGQVTPQAIAAARNS